MISHQAEAQAALTSVLSSPVATPGEVIGAVVARLDAMADPGPSAAQVKAFTEQFRAGARRAGSVLLEAAEAARLTVVAPVVPRGADVPEVSDAELMSLIRAKRGQQPDRMRSAGPLRAGIKRAAEGQQ